MHVNRKVENRVEPKHRSLPSSIQNNVISLSDLTLIVYQNTYSKHIYN